MAIVFQKMPVPDPQKAIAANKFFAGVMEFVKGVVDMSGLPEADRCEICFAGRSNVGKSSLLNTLTGRKALARTSNTPGRTQEINFFSANETLYLVDLPGYGFANAPLPVVEKWQRLLRRYLAGRVNLRRVFVLIDARHGIKEKDHEIMDLLDKSAVTFQVVLTKMDKIKSHEHEALMTSVNKGLARHVTAYPFVIMTSSQTREGMDVLRSTITDILDEF